MMEHVKNCPGCQKPLTRTGGVHTCNNPDCDQYGAQWLIDYTGRNRFPLSNPPPKRVS